MQELLPIESIIQQLNVFASEIADCFSRSEWEKLSLLLTERQQYLESVFVSGVDVNYQVELVQIAKKVLAEDQDALKKVQAHQNKLMDLHGLMDQGIKAVKAYGA